MTGRKGIGKLFDWFGRKFSQVDSFMSHTLWESSIEDFPRWSRPLVKGARTTLLVLDADRMHGAKFHTMSLTYLSILSLVPLGAIVIFFASGVGMRDFLSEFLYENVSNQRLIDSVLSSCDTILQTATSNLFGMVSMLSFFWLVLSLIMLIRETFNSIWGVEESKNYFLLLLLSAGFMVLISILIVLFISGAIFYSRAVGLFFPGRDLLKTSLVPLLSWGIFTLVVILVLALMYKFIPGTRVEWKAAIRPAVLFGVAFACIQYLWLETQTFVSKQNAVYGALALFPLFLIYLNIAWRIILFGAAHSYTIQNEGKHAFLRAKGAYSFDDTQGTMKYLGFLRGNADPATTLSYIEDNLPQLRLLAQKHPADYSLNLGYFLYHAGKLHLDRKDYAPSLEYFKEGARVLESEGCEPSDFEYAILGSCYMGISTCLEAGGDLQGALEAVGRSVESRRSRLKFFQKDPMEELCEALERYGTLCIESGGEKALQEAVRSLQQARKILGHLSEKYSSQDGKYSNDIERVEALLEQISTVPAEEKSDVEAIKPPLFRRVLRSTLGIIFPRKNGR